MKKRVQLHAKDVMCYQENEEYYLNRFPKRAKTEGMVYYFQKIDGVIIKTEITIEQWKELYLFNKRLYRAALLNFSTGINYHKNWNLFEQFIDLCF